MKPTIHLYSICWNEEFMLPYFFMHYDSIVDKYIIFDDGSTDATLTILSNHPKVEIRALPRKKDHDDSYVLAAMDLHNSCWKESRGKADWVIYTAIDELLYHPRLLDYLTSCSSDGITGIPALGYQMISDTLPVKDKSILTQLTSGCPLNGMSKLSIFNPNELSETNFLPGRHVANPTGNVVYPKVDELLNLHYKYIHFESTFARHIELFNKLGSLDKKNLWGIEYNAPREKLKEEWLYYKNNAVPSVFASYYNPDSLHSLKIDRWWRKDSL